MKDSTIPSGGVTVPPTPPVSHVSGNGPSGPSPAHPPAADPVKTPDGALRTPGASDAAPVNEYLNNRFTFGLELGRLRLGRADASVGTVNLDAQYSTPIRGSQNGSHVALVYDARLDIGGDSKLGVFGASFGIGARGAVAVTDGGSQVYAHVIPMANAMGVDDNRNGQANPYLSAGVGGKLELGYALAYSEDKERRLQLAVFGELSTNRQEVGVAVRALSF